METKQLLSEGDIMHIRMLLREEKDNGYAVSVIKKLNATEEALKNSAQLDKKGKMTMGKENRLIQVIRDPHVVFQEGGYSPRTLYSGYRAVILDEADGINIISLADGDLDGDVTLDEVFEFCRYKDVDFATKKIIKESIEAWYKNCQESKVKVTPQENAEWVLDQFRKAKMIDDTLYREILNEYE